MTTTTVEDVINAAAAIATDAAEGRLNVAQLEHQAVQELSALMLIEPEPGSDLEALQAESARRVLARGGVPTNELAEWLAVQRRRENPDADTVLPAAEAATALEPAGPADVLTAADSDALEPYSAESAAVAADAAARLMDVLAALAVEPEPDSAAGCKCAPAPIQRGPRGSTVIAAGRGLPTDNGLRPL